jgi:Mg/Co/Ni transporter MgtE
MTPAAAADVLEDLDEEVAEQILSRMEPEEAADVQTHLAFDEDSAGRLMTTDFVSVPVNATVGDALATIRSMEEVPDPLLAIYVMAADEPGALQGLVRLRNLILADPATPLAEVMDEDVPTVSPHDRAEDAARVLAEYNLLAVPVLDEETRQLLGIVTVDDALAVLLPDVWQRRSARGFAA